MVALFDFYHVYNIMCKPENLGTMYTQKRAATTKWGIPKDLMTSSTYITGHAQGENTGEIPFLLDLPHGGTAPGRYPSASPIPYKEGG